MGKISKQVSKGLGAAIKEAQAKIKGEQVITNTDNPDDTENLSEGVEVSLDVNALLESGVTAQKKRRKGSAKDTKAIATEEPTEEYHMRTHEEVCEDDLKKAHERGYPEPDFDFRNYYEPKTKAYFVRILERLGEKEVIPVVLRTIYPRMMVGSEEKGMCHCIGYNEREQVFLTLHEANNYAKTIKLTPKYAESKPKRHKNDDVEEEDEDIESTIPNLDDDESEE